jgi:hypothetical protein
MTAQTAQEIIADINAHLTKSGKTADRWFVGTTGDIEGRVFRRHRVPRQNHWFIYRRALNHTDATAIARAYQKAGFNGWESGADETAVFIYAYLITPRTVQ